MLIQTLLLDYDEWFKLISEKKQNSTKRISFLRLTYPLIVNYFGFFDLLKQPSHF